MSDLTKIEQLKLEKFLVMGSGYVLDFSNKTFDDFILENTNIDISEDKYKCDGTSKANRLRVFWYVEPNYTVGKLTFAFLQRWKTEKLTKTLEISPLEQILFDECFQISERLLQGGQNDVDEVSIDVHFVQIQKTIIEQIELAQFTIWVAVAWFTDGDLFKHLVAKKQQGINVQLIIIDDQINRDSGLNYESEFETYRIKKSSLFGNIMHNKFCVIDIKTVIHGSYNWTKRAKYNRENIAVASSHEVAERFSEEFIKLKKSYLLSNL